MVKAKKTNRDGYKAVMAALEKQGHKFPQAALGRMLGLTRQAIGQWHHEIPESYAFRVSLLAGVAIEVMLPEIMEEIQSKMKREAQRETAKDR
jgi:hypothetical protein